jgi:hypothetical protein
MPVFDLGPVHGAFELPSLTSSTWSIDATPRSHLDRTLYGRNFPSRVDPDLTVSESGGSGPSPPEVT